MVYDKKKANESFPAHLVNTVASTHVSMLPEIAEASYEIYKEKVFWQAYF